MHVFLLIIIPLVYVANEYVCRDRKIDRDQLFCIISGLIIACIYVLIDFFAIGSTHQWVNRVGSVWSHYLFTETVLPLVICIIPVMLAKAPVRVKAAYLFPVMSAFFAVFIPYKIIAEAGEPDVYTMIFYPLLMAAMLFNVDTAAGIFKEGTDITGQLWLRCLIAGFAVMTGILLPSLFTAYHFLNRAGAGTWVFMALFLISAAGMRVLQALFLPDGKTE